MDSGIGSQYREGLSTDKLEGSLYPKVDVTKKFDLVVVYMTTGQAEELNSLLVHIRGKGKAIQNTLWNAFNSAGIRPGSHLDEHNQATSITLNYQSR